VNVNKKVCFPTRARSVVGMIHASVLVKLESIPCQQDLIIILLDMKLAMPQKDCYAIRT
jgi:hypothetical protein